MGASYIVVGGAQPNRGYSHLYSLDQLLVSGCLDANTLLYRNGYTHYYAINVIQ